MNNMSIPKIRNNCDIKGLVQAYGELNKVNRAVHEILSGLLSLNDEEIGWLQKEKIEAQLQILRKVQSDIEKEE